MSNAKTAAFLACLAGALAGCSSTQSKPAASEAHAARSSPALAPAAPPLTPVPAPSDLIAVLRLRNPAELLNRITSWSGAPFDWKQMVAREEPGLERVVAFEAPIDAAIEVNASTALLRAPFMAASVGLTSLSAALEYARAQGEVVRPLTSGMYGLGDAPHRCVIAQALGSAPARLVCGNKAADVKALLPYLTRGMPRESFGNSDVHFELRGEVVRARYGRDVQRLKSLVPLALSQLALDVPRFDHALGDALYAAADETSALLQDFSRLDVDLAFKTDSETAELTANASFASQSSWFAQTLFDKPPAVAPDAFWALPKDAPAAGFGYSLGSEHFTAMRRTFSELVDGLLEHEKASAALRAQVKAVMLDSFELDAPWASAKGVLSEPSNSSAEPDRAQRFRQTLGWQVSVVAANADVFAKDFGRLAKLAANPELRRLLTARAKLSPNQLPSVRRRPGAIRELPGAIEYEVTIPADLLEETLPAIARRNSVDVRSSAPGRGKRAPTPVKSVARSFTVAFVIVPDGARTWFGVSSDAPFIHAELAKLKKAPPEATLAARSDLSDFKSLQAKRGGFLSLAALLSHFGAGAVGARHVSRSVGLLPHHGETPLTFAFQTVAGTPASARWWLRLPKAAFEDAGALARALNTVQISYVTVPGTAAPSAP